MRVRVYSGRSLLAPSPASLAFIAIDSSPVNRRVPIFISAQGRLSPDRAHYPFVGVGMGSEKQMSQFVRRYRSQKARDVFTIDGTGCLNPPEENVTVFALSRRTQERYAINHVI